MKEYHFSFSIGIVAKNLEEAEDKIGEIITPKGVTIDDYNVLFGDGEDE